MKNEGTRVQANFMFKKCFGRGFEGTVLKVCKELLNQAG